MQYPREFPPQARARVEAERLKAGMQLEQRMNQVPWSKHGPGTAHEEILRKYILRVFLVFAEEACKLGSQGLWTVDRIRSQADEFLRRFTIEAYYDKGHDKDGSKLREMTSHLSGSILSEVEREFRKSAEWHQFEEELLAVAEAAGGRAVGPASPDRMRIRGERDKNVAARKTELRNMLRGNKNPPSKDVCTRWDAQDIKPPERWQQDGIATWKAAQANPTYRGRLKKLISDDKKDILARGS